jgi:predicted MFS family arabinose efflux permease
LYAVTALLIFTGLIHPWHVYLTAFLMACVQVFLQPSRSAMISDAVPRHQVTSAIGLNAIVFNMARSTGPALSGLLIAHFSTGVSYAAQALFMILATIWTMQLTSVPMSSGQAVTAAMKNPSARASSKAGNLAGVQPKYAQVS